MFWDLYLCNLPCRVDTLIRYRIWSNTFSRKKKDINVKQLCELTKKQYKAINYDENHARKKMWGWCCIIPFGCSHSGLIFQVIQLQQAAVYYLTLWTSPCIDLTKIKLYSGTSSSVNILHCMCCQVTSDIMRVALKF